MLDVLLTAVICCLVTLLLLKRTNRIVAFAVTILVGLIVGYPKFTSGGTNQSRLSA